MTGDRTTTPRRERARAATIEEIKQTALELMRKQGTADVRFTDIAREMGMTPPALYRYFGDRDELLTALIADSYDDLARAVAATRDTVAEKDIGGRWLAAAQAYRRWANDEPARFALIFGLPIPGFVPQDEGATTEAAQRAMRQLSALFVDAAHTGRLRKPLVREVDPAVQACAVGQNEELDVSLSPESFQAMLHAWAALHGFTCLEAYGHFDFMEPAARESLFVAQIQLAGKAAGLPAPDKRDG